MRTMSRLFALVLWLICAHASHAAEPVPRTPRADAVALPNGLALPYPTLRVFRAFGRCKNIGKRPERFAGSWKSHEHEGIDLGGLGPDGGLGSAVRSLTRARVVEIARGSDLPPKFGITDLRDGPLERDGETYPRSFELQGYGLVHFFTRARGWYRTGNMVVTVGVDGRLANHRIRYMHLGAARPDMKVGDLLEPGEELGVLGGTAVQDAAPHVHIDIRDPAGESVDVAPLIGLVTSAWCGVPRRQALIDAQAFKAAAGKSAWRPDTWAPPVGEPALGGRALPTIDLLRTPAPLVAAGLVPAHARFWHDVLVPPPCTPYVVEEDFASGAYAGHAWRFRALRGKSYDLAVTAIGAVPSPHFAVLDQPAEALCYPTPEPSESALRVTATGEQRVRIDIGATTDALIAIIGVDPYRITLSERCKTAH